MTSKPHPRADDQGNTGLHRGKPISDGPLRNNFDGPNRFNDGPGFGNKDRNQFGNNDGRNFGNNDNNPFGNNDFTPNRDKLLNPDGSTRIPISTDAPWMPNDDRIPRDGNPKPIPNFPTSGMPTGFRNPVSDGGNNWPTPVNNPFTGGKTGPANADSYIPEGPRQSTLARGGDLAPKLSADTASDFANGFTREGRVGNEGTVNGFPSSNINPRFGGTGDPVNPNQNPWGGLPVNNTPHGGVEVRPSDTAPRFDGLPKTRPDPNDNSNQRQDFGADDLDIGNEDSNVSGDWRFNRDTTNNAGGTGQSQWQKIDPGHNGVQVGTAPGASRF